MTTIREDYDRLEDILRQVTELTAGFHRSLDTRPVGAVERPVDKDEPLPDRGVGTPAALAAFKHDVMPDLSGSIGPRYLGFVTGGATPAAIAGDWLAAAVDQNTASPGDSIAPALTQQTLGYLLDLFDLPRNRFDGSFTTGATASNLLALLVAREWCAARLGVDVTGDGMAALAGLKVFSATPHASMIKMMGVAGIGRNAHVAVDRLPDTEAMDPDALERTLASSDTPAKVVVASAGTVTATSFDDLNRIADIAEKHGAFLHVDGAFGIFARCLDSHKHLIAGLERADSITGDAHKWLNVPYDSAFFFTRHIGHLEGALSMMAAYLKIESEVPTYMNRAVEGSQRFRALPVWLSARAYGRAGLTAMVAESCRLAQELGAWIEASPDFELLCPVGLNVVAYRGLFEGSLNQQNAGNERLLASLNATGKVYCTPGLVDGKAGIRAAFSNWMTGADDLPVVFAALEAAHARVRK